MPFAIFQVYLPSGKPFQVEFRVSDGTLTKRRLIFTHGTKNVIKNQLHARIPSALFRRSIWLNLWINVKEFYENWFPDCEFKEIDSVSISAQWKWRKIFFMNSPIIDTSQLDDESGIIPDVDSLEKNWEAIPKANDFKFGVNFMNQLINLYKLDLYLGSTIDDSVALDSIEENTGKKSLHNSSKIRVGSGNTQLKHHKGLLKTSKIDDNWDDATTLNKNSEDGNNDYENKLKHRTRYSSVSPFPKINKNKNDPNEKSTDDEDLKGWGARKNIVIDKRNSTKVTNNTNSENDDNSWIKSHPNKSTTKANNKQGKRGHSQVKKIQSKLKEKSIDLTNSKCISLLKIIFNFTFK